MKYLLTIALGPVQEFIAAARRTADLKAGSQLLVETARKVAAHLEAQGAELIFPANTHIDPPNKIVCIVEGDPKTLAIEARKIAQEHLQSEWKSIEGALAALINAELATHQIRNFLEFYVAWAPFQGEYAAAQQQAERLLAGRKALRDFVQPHSLPGLPKSPLDPSRDTVVRLKGNLEVVDDAQKDANLRLKPRETLDAISLLKRVKGRQLAGKVPSTIEMALRSFWKVADQNAPTAVYKLNQIKENLGLAEVGGLFFLRWKDLETEQPIDEETRNDVKKLRHEIITAVGVPEDQLGYYAILVADGDRMGERISTLKTIEAHKTFSQQVASFAGEVHRIVERHGGYLVYCGGDDVMALLPANRALACAKALRDTFQQKVPGATLSAGIALVHFLENLQNAVELARQAEREAKHSRNAVAVALHPRSGEAITATTQWNHFAIWQEWIGAFRQGLARGFPYELYALGQEYEKTSIDAAVLKAEAERVLKRKEGAERVQVQFPDWAFQNASRIREFAHLLVIARFLTSYPEVADDDENRAD